MNMMMMMHTMMIIMIMMNMVRMIMIMFSAQVSNGKLSISLERQLKMSGDAMCVCYSPVKAADKRMVAVGLLDNTIKVFYDDSLKFFLSLYGHKLPVMCMDISYDSKLLISGSADKTIKIWGLDFGDCHRSLIAHDDSVTSLRFQPNTHYAFSTSKDGVLKYWDVDRFEQIQRLPGHVGHAWCVDVAGDGAVVVTCGQDRSLRLWERSEDLVFVEEERERELEASVNDALEKDQNQSSIRTIDRDGDRATVAPHMVTNTEAHDHSATLATIETLKGGERLMESIDLVEAELAAAGHDGDEAASPSSYNPLLMGMHPHKYLLTQLRTIKAPDVEQALLVMPFHYALRLVPLLVKVSDLIYWHFCAS